jgi:putative transposase
MKATIHREVNGYIVYTTVSKTKIGKYFVLITTDFKVKKERINNKQIGVGLGIKDFVVIFNEEKHHLSIKEDGKFKFLHRKLSKKIKEMKTKVKLN